MLFHCFCKNLNGGPRIYQDLSFIMDRKQQIEWTGTICILNCHPHQYAPHFGVQPVLYYTAG